MDFLIDILKSFLWALLLWVVLLPVVFVVTTPVVLFISLIGPPRNYFTRVRNGYGFAFRVWDGMFIHLPDGPI